jgi:hypothetical protein
MIGSERQMVCRLTGGCHHLRNRIDCKDLAFRSDQGSHAQCWLSGTGSKIQNRAPARGGVASYGTSTWLTNVPQLASTVLGPPGIYSTPSQMDPSESATAAE